jgi:hypothetical protein
LRNRNKAKKGTVLPIIEEPEAEGEMEEKEEPEEDIDEEEKAQREYRKQKEQEEREMKQYGRRWIWQNYISENRKKDWEDVATGLMHINDHVVQDIIDYILIKAFPPSKQKNRKDIKEEVDNLLIESGKVQNKDNKEEIDRAKRIRELELSLRPPYVWNFFETRIDEEEKVKLQTVCEKKEEEKLKEPNEDNDPYLINHDANPEICYKNEELLGRNRVTKLLKDLENLTYNLKTHEQAKWNMLTELCIDIFKE